MDKIVGTSINLKAGIKKKSFSVSKYGEEDSFLMAAKHLFNLQSCIVFTVKPKALPVTYREILKHCGATKDQIYFM